MPILAAVPALDQAPSIDLTLSFEKADALVNLLARNSADLPRVLADMLPGLREAADTALDAMMTAAFGPDGLEALAA